MSTLLAIIVGIVMLGILIYVIATRNEDNRGKLLMHVANGDIDPSVLSIEAEYNLKYMAYDEEYNYKTRAYSYQDALKKFVKDTKLPASAVINPIRIVTDEMS